MNRTMKLKVVYLVVGYMFLSGIVSVAGWASQSSYRARLAGHWRFSQGMLRSYEGGLRAAGCDVNDVEAIKRELIEWNEPKPSAVCLLAHKIGHRAIPAIRHGLDARSIYNRCLAAQVMALLGDLSGLERMREMITEYTRAVEQDDKVQRDPEATQKDKGRASRSKNRRLARALEAANVLAEFGDTSVFELAARAAIESKFNSLRLEAIYVLVELGKIDEGTLRTRGIDPEAVLMGAAESETNQDILMSLSGSVGTMRPESAIRILEKVRLSPHASDERRQDAAALIKRYKRRIEKEKRVRAENNNSN